MGIEKLFFHFPLRLYVCVLRVVGNASYAFTTRTDSSNLEGLSWGRKKSFLFLLVWRPYELYVPSSPWVDFRSNYLNFDCSAGMKMQVCALLILISTSWAWCCRNTAKWSLNTWHVCVKWRGSWLLAHLLIKGVWTVKMVTLATLSKSLSVWSRYCPWIYRN